MGELCESRFNYAIQQYDKIELHQKNGNFLINIYVLWIVKYNSNNYAKYMVHIMWFIELTHLLWTIAKC